MISIFYTFVGVFPISTINTCDLDIEKTIFEAGLEEAQAGIKIAWRNLNNLRYAEAPPS